MPGDQDHIEYWEPLPKPMSQGSSPAGALFASLRAAKEAGYTVRCVAAGPRDMPHSGVFIYGPRSEHEYLVSADCSWGIREARAAALGWINEHEANEKS